MAKQVAPQPTNLHSRHLLADIRGTSFHFICRLEETPLFLWQCFKFNIRSCIKSSGGNDISICGQLTLTLPHHKLHEDRIVPKIKSILRWFVSNRSIYIHVGSVLQTPPLHSFMLYHQPKSENISIRICISGVFATIGRWTRVHVVPE